MRSYEWTLALVIESSIRFIVFMIVYTVCLSIKALKFLKNDITCYVIIFY
jgi:hypothetical protein